MNARDATLDPLTDDAVRAAIHAPTSKNWISSFPYPFGPNGTFSAYDIRTLAVLTTVGF